MLELGAEPDRALEEWRVHATAVVRALKTPEAFGKNVCVTALGAERGLDGHMSGSVAAQDEISGESEADRELKHNGEDGCEAVSACSHDSRPWGEMLAPCPQQEQQREPLRARCHDEPWRGHPR